ncbi:MAG: hypothetical protein H0U27_08215, partial [Nitrosopumilus sp.]|nr:hypothetical protein [Nitrosopumilus sp.]
TAQTLTFTSAGSVNIIDGVFNGDLTVSASGFLLKNNTFLSTTSFTKNGTPNFQSDGGNTYLWATTISNSGSGGRIRMATVTADNYKNNATFNSTGQDLQVAYSGDNYFEGDITLNSNKVVFNNSSGRVIFTGINPQSLHGGYNYAFKKVTLNKYSNHVTANTTFSIDDTLTFIKGNFITTSTNLLTMKATSKAVGASDNSFISGPVKKVGNTAFVFPTGKYLDYRAIEISAPSTSTSEFIGEFFCDSISVNTDAKDTTLARLLRKQYWNLNRTSGSSNVYVTLAWDSLSPIVDTLITIASWNGTQWKDMGKGVINGTILNGTLKSSIVTTNFYQYIIGYGGGLGGGSGVLIPAICQEVISAGALQYCLNHSYSAVVVGNINLDASVTLPLVVSAGFMLTSPYEWWKPECPLITSDHTANFTVNSPVRPLYLFEMETGATFQNLRIRGANCNYKDYNESEKLCGGIYIVSGTTSTTATIKNCEISCFSQSGIWKDDEPLTLNVENCYIHKVKGVSATGIGYGIWTEGDYDASPVQVMNYHNNIYDDCKAAIDGQGKVTNWNITNCSFSQFFISEDINMHNNNKFRIYDSDDTNPFDYHYCYSGSACVTDCFFGIYCPLTPPCTFPSACNDEGDYVTDWIDCASNTVNIPIYDVGGAETLISDCIFHKKWGLLSSQINITLPYPNRDESFQKYGDDDNKVTINQNTFTTEWINPTNLSDLNQNNNFKNRGGYARIADNYIESCVWSSDPLHIISNDNYFSYEAGKTVLSQNV